MHDIELGVLVDMLSPVQQRTSVNPGLGQGWGAAEPGTAWKLTSQLV